MQNVYSLVKSFYLNVDNATVIIGGDGAPWIRQCNSYWPGSLYILDKFHAVRKLSQVFNPKNEELKAVYDETKALFIEGNYEDLMTLLNQKWFKDSAKNLRLIQLKSYFELNEKEASGVSNQNHKFNIGCNVEGAISHHIKWLLGYGSKAFSKKVYAKMLDIHIAKVNSISIIDLVKEKIIVKHNEKHSFFRQSYWKKKISNKDFQGELPITKNGSKAGRWAKNFATVF